MAEIIEQPDLGDVNPGDSIQGFYILRKCEMRTRRDGSPYLALELADRTARVQAKIWQDAEKFSKELTAGEVVKIRGVMQEYQGHSDLRVDLIRMANEDDPVEAEKLLRTSSEDLEALYQRLLDVIAGFENEHLRDLLQAIFEDEDFRGQFSRAPGGKMWHHAEFGGLLAK